MFWLFCLRQLSFQPPVNQAVGHAHGSISIAYSYDLRRIDGMTSG